MTRDEALSALGESTAAATAAVLRTIVPDGVDEPTVTAVPGGTPGPAPLPLPAVATRVAYTGGVTGGTVLVLTRTGARKLAAAMLGAEPEDPEAELTELELATLGEAADRVLAAAAAATGAVLGGDVGISSATTTVVATAPEWAGQFDTDADRAIVSLTVLGEPCLLVHLIPDAFVGQLTGAPDEAASEAAGDTGAPDEATSEAAGDAGAPGATIDADTLRVVPVRVSAELGRTRLPIGRAVGLAPGTVVELDRSADEPVDLYVSGHRFARGSLVIVDGDWAVEVLEILPHHIPLDQ